MTQIKCLKCGKLLESKHVHDFVSCGCENSTFLDGGDEYLRYGGKDIGLIEVLQDTHGICPGESYFKRVGFAASLTEAAFRELLHTMNDMRNLKKDDKQYSLENLYPIADEIGNLLKILKKNAIMEKK
jgi:hypothetical protein